MTKSPDKKRPSIFDDGSAQKRGAIAGRNIYIDDKGQTIMYISRTQTGYILKEKDAKNFNLYHNRIALGIAVAMLLMSLTSDWRISIIAGLVLFGVLQYRFVKSWLPTLPQIPNFKPKQKKSFIEGLVETNNKGRCILLAVLYALLGILLVVNGIIIKSDIVVIIFEVATMLACLYMSAQYVIAISKMKYSKDELRFSSTHFSFISLRIISIWILLEVLGIG